MAGKSELGPLCILVIDDNCDSADILALLLLKLGHTVHTAHGGRTALEQIETLHPDLLFLDLGMPGVDGFEVARRVRQRSELTYTRIVAVTGYVDQARRSLATEAGFDDYLIKPITLADIEAVIARTLELLEQSGHAPHPNC